jgi:hypothetical protein
MFPMQGAGYPMVVGPDGQPMPMVMQAAPVRSVSVLYMRARAKGPS